jgi:hypothetical protein
MTRTIITTTAITVYNNPPRILPPPPFPSRSLLYIPKIPKRGRSPYSRKDPSQRRANTPTNGLVPQEPSNLL